MAAISAMIWRLRYLLCCRYSPKKCFAVLVLTTLTLSLIFVWNQSNAPPDVSFHQPERIHYSASKSLPSIPPEVFQFVQQPKHSICGESKKDEKVEVDRFTELLEARPDGEDPETPPVVIPPGIIFVPVLCGESASLRQLIRRTWGSGGWLRDHHVRVIFVCGGRRETAETKSDAWKEEIALYGDILQVDQEVPQPIDSSLLMVASLSWIETSCSISVPRFVAKVNSDIYLNIPGLLPWLDGLLDGVHSSYSKDESIEKLHEEFYVIKGSQSIEHMLLALWRVQPNYGEKNFITSALADSARVPRFATLRMADLDNSKRNGEMDNGRTASAVTSHPGCWVRQQVVFTGLSTADFAVIWSLVNQDQSSMCSKGDGCCQDSFPIALTVLWTLFLLLMCTIVHSCFWSSLSAFCDDMCNAVDSGAEDEDDSTENSVAAAGYESDNEAITSGNYSSYFDVGRPYATLTQHRF